MDLIHIDVKRGQQRVPQRLGVLGLDRDEQRLGRPVKRALLRKELYIVPHSPWLVQWQTSDTSSFGFSIPALTSSRSVAQWTPGQSLSPTAGYDDNKTGSGDSYGGLRGGVLAAVIVVPVIVFLVAVGGCVACFVIRKKKRRQAQEVSAAQDSQQQ
ncbi:hypothetical protein NLG97_g38 [Lecanicillium saksenae]|uniref:Uncharacterized protein n=1 Tax=Lecanicillium saksenae TaxID=468837 RepID=A0ACC1R7Z6_9HYPO|nr:hypothetical protein NLG97_g38 [Lecanicillium saksenae]